MSYTQHKVKLISQSYRKGNDLNNATTTLGTTLNQHKQKQYEQPQMTGAARHAWNEKSHHSAKAKAKSLILKQKDNKLVQRARTSSSIHSAKSAGKEGTLSDATIVT